MDRLYRATINTWNGLRAAARSEAAFRQELVVLALAVPLAFVVTEGAWKRLALVGVVAFLLVVELLNTAIEKLADRVSLEREPQIGRVKDMGSAAVGIALLMAGAIWLLALAERIGLIPRTPDLLATLRLRSPNSILPWATFPAMPTWLGPRANRRCAMARTSLRFPNFFCPATRQKIWCSNPRSRQHADPRSKSLHGKQPMAGPRC